ncbi:MAG: atoS 3 [Symbiobacteriaceae bacterium]|jgi:two-component system sensor histidine kinase AtoS|nr:atoS 3 [Symbiobacteriaceae bacterium]
MWRPAILQRAEALLLDEKAAKLVGLARLLDQFLGAGFDAWLTRAGADPGQAEADLRMATLSQALRTVTDDLASAFPKVGLGYYDARLDRIVAYAPSGSLGALVGVSPPADHLGRIAMAEREDKLAVGSMVRGDAMNCMHPLVREGQVIGFAFANESLEDIYRQMYAEDGRHHQAAAVLGLSSLAVFAGSTMVSIEALRRSRGAGSLLLDLEQIEQYVRLFLDNLQVGVLLVGPGGIIEYRNGAMDGFAPAAVAGRPWAEVALALDLPVEPDESHRYARVELAEGRTAEVLSTRLPGEAAGARVILFEDASRTRQDRAYFERAERLALAGELATAIAHEIRNPLTVVAGSIQLIPQRLGDDQFLLSVAEIAGRELGRVNRTIQGLLGFARYSEPQMQPLDLGEVLTQAVEFIRWYAVKHGVTIAHLPAPRPLYIYGDAEHLQQALLNLMMNGIQAMEGGGTLSVTVEHPGGSRFAHLAIADEGAGIAPDQLAKIWEVFYSSKPGGTGLGLPVVQRIIDEHRGQVEVASAPGKGTCFTVLLPLTTRPDLAEEE